MAWSWRTQALDNATLMRSSWHHSPLGCTSQRKYRQQTQIWQLWNRCENSYVWWHLLSDLSFSQSGGRYTHFKKERPSVCHTVWLRKQKWSAPRQNDSAEWVCRHAATASHGFSPPVFKNWKFLTLPASSPAPVAFSRPMHSNVAPVLLWTYRKLNGPFLCFEVSFCAPLIQIPSLFGPGPFLSWKLNNCTIQTHQHGVITHKATIPCINLHRCESFKLCSTANSHAHEQHLRQCNMIVEE